MSEYTDRFISSLVVDGVLGSLFVGDMLMTKDLELPAFGREPGWSALSVRMLRGEVLIKVNVVSRVKRCWSSELTEDHIDRASTSTTSRSLAKTRPTSWSARCASAGVSRSRLAPRGGDGSSLAAS